MDLNKEKISEHCWAGRTIGAVLYLFEKYAYIFEQIDIKDEEWIEEPFKYISNIAQFLRDNIPQQDSRIVDSLLEKSHSVFERDQTQFNKTDKKEFEYGMTEVKYILRKGENLEVILQERVFSKFYKKIYYLPTYVHELLLIGIFGLVIGGGIFAFIKIQNIPYFVEQRLYNKIKSPEKRGILTYPLIMWNCESYIEQFPNGKHITNVKERYKKLRNEFEDVAYELTLKGGEISSRYILHSESSSGLNSRIESYKELYPNGKYLDKLYAYYDSLWTNEINRFSELNSHEIDTKAHKAMLDMLKYMEENHIDTIVANTKIDVSEIMQIYDSNNCYDAIVREDFEKRYSKSELIPIYNDQLKDIGGYWVNEKFSNMFDSCMCEKTNRLEHCKLYEMVDIKDAEDKCAPLNKYPQLAIDVKITNKELTKNGKLFPQFYVIEGDSSKMFYDINYEMNIKLIMPNKETYNIYKDIVSIADVKNISGINSSADMFIMLRDFSISGFLERLGL